VTAVVQAEQDTRGKFGGCGTHAEAGPALKVIQEGLQDLVQDLIRGLGRAGVTSIRPRPCRASSTSSATADRSAPDRSWAA